MTVARREIVSSGEEAVYHCITRCVRRAFLCGADAVTGRNFDHRKGWVRDRLRFLGEVFAIDVLGYALMSTHGHIMLRTRPDILESWSKEEVVRRWFRLFPKRYLSKGEREELIMTIARDKLEVSKLRERLGSLSWLMKSLNEYIARRANEEDNCTGRFWEGRFKCQLLKDDAAILSCSVYIDLNPIRAKAAMTPEESEFTGAYERILDLRRNNGKESTNLWLSPIQDSSARRGFLNISLPEYLSILDSTGRSIRDGKRGKISSRLDPILTRIGINPEHWLHTAQHFRHWFAHVAGNSAELRRSALAAGKVWRKGVRIAKIAFA